MSCIEAVESGKHKAFLNVISETGNTVCGRHPIGIVMAGLQLVRESWDVKNEPKEDSIGRHRGLFTFVRYERSSDCVTLKDSSVSYASAFVVLDCKIPADTKNS